MCLCYFLANTCKGHFRKEWFLLTLGLRAHSPSHWEGHGGSNARRQLCHTATSVRSRREVSFGVELAFFHSSILIQSVSLTYEVGLPPLSKFFWKHLRIHTQRYISSMAPNPVVLTVKSVRHM